MLKNNIHTIIQLDDTTQIAVHISVEPLFTRDQERCTLLTKDTTTQTHAGGHDVTSVTHRVT